MQNKTINNWDNEIAEIEKFFATTIIPIYPIQLDSGTKIMDTSLMVESHILIVKSNNGNPTFLPFLERLQKLKNILSN